MEDESDMKKPTGRSHDEHGDRTILPPTRLSRRSKKLSEVSTAETGLVTSDGCGNEDQELTSTQNTPSSSASSSRYEINSCLCLYIGNIYIYMP